MKLNQILMMRYSFVTCNISDIENRRCSTTHHGVPDVDRLAIFILLIQFLYVVTSCIGKDSNKEYYEDYN